MRFKVLFGAVGTAALLFGAPSFALSLTPADADCSGTPTQPQDPNFLSELCGNPNGLTLAYKDDGSEEGAFAPSYTVVFTNTAQDPSDATITWDGPGTIDCPVCWLVVKDGDHSPQFYGFDLGDWDGQETITLTGFWPEQGSISHVSIWTGPGGDDDDDDDTDLPEPGSLALLGLGLIAVGLSRRRVIRK